MIVSIQTAGVTAFAIAFTDDGNRLVIAQPDSGRRLVVGDRVVVDPRRVQYGILREWAWEDAGAQQAKATIEAEAKRRHEERVEHVREQYRRAIALAAPPARVEDWQSTMRKCAAELVTETADEHGPEGPPSAYVRAERDELRRALGEYVEWTERAGVDIDQIASVLRALFDIHLLPDSCALSRTSAPFNALHESWDLHAPASACAILAALRKHRALRDAFEWLDVDLVGMWAEESDIASFFELDPKRYFVIAQHREDAIFWAVDARKPSGPLVEITWMDGNDELMRGPKTLRALLDDRLNFLEECVDDDPHVSDEERDAVQRLMEWIRS